MTLTALTVLIYGVLVAAGGLLGYVKAGSVPSLFSGLLAGATLVGASIAMTRGATQGGWWVSLLITALLLFRFGSVAARNFKIMPGGVMIAMSVIVLIILLARRGK